MVVSGAYGQAQTPDVPSLTRQPAPDIRVEVTGSNIKRVEGEGALPVTVITRDQNRTDRRDDGAGAAADDLGVTTP